jgi:choice-of-anchor C domain-containing protein
MVEEKNNPHNDPFTFQTVPSSIEVRLANGNSRLQPGDLIAGTYKILEFIGSGGMSDVYKCEDLSIGRIVAVKTLQTGYSADSLRRFQTEGKAIAKLEHPNILKLYGLQVTSESLPVLVMEYVPGCTLASLLSRKEGLPVQRALRIASQIAEGLIAAEEEGIVHRDLKPSNIMIVKPGSIDETVKILDFGIAKIQGEAPINATRTGEVFGTPQYMSPEQVLGKKCDARADQYTFGCVLFEMLTGEPPFSADNSFSVMTAHVSEPIPSLSKRAKQAIPAHLDAVLNKLLQKEPAGRYSSMAEAKEAIFSATPFSEKILQNKMLVAGLCVVVLSIVGIFGFSVMDKHRNAPTGEVNSISKDQNQTKAKEFSGIASGTKDSDVPKGTPDEDPSKASKDVAAAKDTKTDRYVKDHLNKLIDKKELVFGTNGQMGSDLTNAGLESIAKSDKLESLSLQNCFNITSDGLKVLLVEDAKNSGDKHDLKLKNLDLSYTKVDNNAAETLGKLRTLEMLRLNGTDVGTETCMCLKDLPKLNYLYLGNTLISPASLKYLRTITTLRELNLQHDQVGGGIHLLRTMRLKKLDLKSVDNLTDDDFTNGILQLKSLTDLYLSETNINDKQLLLLAQLPNLKRLEVKNCTKLNESGLLKFHNASPECELITGGKLKTEDQFDMAASKTVGPPLIANGDFEDDKTPDNYIDFAKGSKGIPHWQISYGSVGLTGKYWAAASRSKSLELNGEGPGAISQTIPTVPGKRYLISFEATTNPDKNFQDAKVIRVSVGKQTKDFKLYYPANTRTTMKWKTRYWSFEAKSNNSTLEFRSMSDGGCGPIIDAVSVKQLSDQQK